MLAEAGLVIRDAVYFDFNLLPPPLDRRLARLGVACSEYLESSPRSWLRKLANGFLVSATKSA